MSTPRGIRNNNPGNIDFNAGAFARDPWVGEIGPETLSDGSEGRFTTFDKPEHGIRALVKILLTYYRHYDLDTISKIIARWAPPSENDTNAYADSVGAFLGIDPDEPLPLDRPGAAAAILERLAETIIRHENGQQPYAAATIRAGVDLALA